MSISRRKKDRGEQYGKKIGKWFTSTIWNITRGRKASPWSWMPLVTRWLGYALFHTMVFVGLFNLFCFQFDMWSLMLFNDLCSFPWRPVKNSGKWWLIFQSRLLGKREVSSNVGSVMSLNLWTGEGEATWLLWRHRCDSQRRVPVFLNCWGDRIDISLCGVWGDTFNIYFYFWKVFLCLRYVCRPYPWPWSPST